ncbi:WhiB family transcriptional regulator [Streptomyces parvulus]|uniref:WhiB family transcriptional regulator n=1 Tax=Streptomyces parvulus TaxID=146923 RepID=UPI0033D650C9
MSSLDWMARAACIGVDTRAFYANGKHSREQVNAAKKVCNACPVRAQCAAYAITTGEKWGVWGGMTQKQLRQKRRRSRPATRGQAAA